MNMANETVQFLQLLNILLTSGVLVALIAAGVAYGKLVQEQKDHGRRLTRIEDRLDGHGQRIPVRQS